MIASWVYVFLVNSQSISACSREKKDKKKSCLALSGGLVCKEKGGFILGNEIPLVQQMVGPRP